MKFDELIGPISREKFFAEFASKQAVLIEGPDDKFSDLFSWNELNRVISQHRVEPPRCRVEKVGAHHSELSIIQYEPTTRGFLVPKIDPRLLYKRLSDGATFILDSVHETSTALEQLGQEVESIFSSKSLTNLYVSFGSTPGFGCHWDSRDVFAVQISGRKHWKIYKPTREAPLYRDFHTKNDEPSEVWWEGILGAGSLLYVPRGWWHEVTSIDEPSMHLTIGADPLTGVDYLTWMADQLRKNLEWRKEIPRFSGDIFSFQKMLKSQLESSFEEYGINAFLKHRAEEKSLRPKYGLPYAVDGCDWPIPQGSILRKVRPTMNLIPSKTGVILRSNNMELELAPETENLLRALDQNHEISFIELYNSQNELSMEDAHLVVSELLKNAIIYVV